MKFRPCIDLHGGCVKQIVGSTLTDETSQQQQQQASLSSSSTTTTLATNFSTDRPAAEFAQLYQTDKLTGGHVIMLGPGNTEAAKNALAAYPNQLQVGGGMTDANAKEWLDAGASHIIATSHVFRKDGVIDYDRLQRLVEITGKERLVLDLSCRKRPAAEKKDNGDDGDDHYYVVTNKWQTFTTFPITADNVRHLAQYCDEFLVHGVDVEGKQCGILQDLVTLLGESSPIPVTYAGGVRSLEDLDLVNELGQGRVDCTVGSALDIFGGTLPYRDVVEWHNSQQQQEK
mmetsp:Transcript_24308/g.55757  ORF Transcript_24308/g.55757 Transcript_24308/m.55757 type:complete len:287 (-) Transcript_24308:78-938(-)